MALGRRGKPRGTRVSFATEHGRRKVTVESGDLAEVERRRLQRLLRAVPVARGTVNVRRDWSGHRRVTFAGDIPEGQRQLIRNIIGNLARLRSA